MKWNRLPAPPSVSETLFSCWQSCKKTSERPLERNMTKLELLRLIGDVITEIDTAIGDLLPSDPNQRQLQDLRILLDDRQRQLSRQVFDENTVAFQNATQELKAVNDQIVSSLRNIQNMVDTINNVTRFLNSVTSLLTTVGAL